MNDCLFLFRFLRRTHLISFIKNNSGWERNKPVSSYSMYDERLVGICYYCVYNTPIPINNLSLRPQTHVHLTNTIHKEL